MMTMGRRPEAGREVDVCLTEEELAFLCELLRWRAEVVVWPAAAEMTSRLLVVLEQRLREVTGPGGAVESSTRTGDQEGH